MKWKKALKKFQEHQESERHRVGVDYEMTIAQTHTDVIELANEATKKLRMNNRRCFVKILESLQFLARQGLSLRGDDDSNSNFIQLLKLRCLDDPLLSTWLESKGGRYYSHQIQNEILSIMANNVLRELVSDIGDKCYSIVADEYTDISNKEQLTFCL